MAKTKISEFSSTPANNTDIDSINIAEGCAPSGINDAIRELMAQLKDFQTGAQGDSFNGPIGTSTAAAGAFTTLSATGAITSTLATGSAPLVIASTTKVANLNVDLLDGADWASPAALGSTTPAAGSFTTLGASSTATLNTLVSSGATLTGGTINGMTIGATTASTGAFTTLAASSSVTLSGGTANGVTYLNGSKVLTSGSALTFDGTILGVGSGAGAGYGSLQVRGGFAYINEDGINTKQLYLRSNFGGSGPAIQVGGTDPLLFVINASEQMRLTSTGLGIGTSSPNAKLRIQNDNSTVPSLIIRDGGTPAANMIEVSSNATGNALILNASGNLGLGVTPSAWGSGGNFNLKNDASISANGGDFNIGANYYNNAGWKFVTSGYATQYYQTSGQHRWYVSSASGTAGNAISFTQAMTLDASGNFYVGTTSQAGGSNITFNQPANADMKIAASVSTGTRAAYQAFISNTVTTIGTENSTGGSLVSGSAAYSTVISNNGAYPISFGTNNTERARIDSVGRFLVGTTGGSTGYKMSLCPTGTHNSGIYYQSDANDTNAMDFRNISGTQVGSIYVTASSTTFATSSDYRLKNTIAPMTGALAKVALLKPCTYKWNADGYDGEGFIAHELAEVCPQAVVGEKDAVDENGNPKYQGIDTSFLVATLTAALQELNAKFDAYVASHP